MLELGAGTGVLGALCAQLGASQVTITDLEVVVPLLELNLLLNFASGTTEGGKGGETNSPQSATPVAMALPWGEPLSPQITARIGGLPAECLLLCDVVYEPHLFPLLLATMAELCGPDTLILLAYRRRNPDEWQFFERLAKVRRFRYIQ